VKLAEARAEMKSLLDGPSPATLTLYGEDREAITSPVWFQINGDAFECVMALKDHKLELLRRDQRCTLLIFETAPPFRGVRVRGRAELLPDEGSRTRLAIASRYLGEEGGQRYADVDRRPPGYVVRLRGEFAKAWDLSASL
jgi:nitroimidazol reductase NimA-like FMN-containing flavoprotein (pyridoxamine 5'-phosphate oxidase superfamily)